VTRNAPEVKVIAAVTVEVTVALQLKEKNN